MPPKVDISGKGKYWGHLSQCHLEEKNSVVWLNYYFGWKWTSEVRHSYDMGSLDIFQVESNN